MPNNKAYLANRNLSALLVLLRYRFSGVCYIQIPTKLKQTQDGIGYHPSDYCRRLRLPEILSGKKVSGNRKYTVRNPKHIGKDAFRTQPNAGNTTKRKRSGSENCC